MQIEINNTLSGDSWIAELDRPELMVGRPPSDPDDPLHPDIALASRLVSRSHALIRANGEGWTIVHSGVNATLLNGQAIDTGRAYALAAGDQIQIAEFVLALVDGEDGGQRPATRPPLDLLMELEREVHNALLDRMDLRRGEGAPNLESSETRAKIEAHLDSLLGAMVPALPPESIDALLHTAVYRRLNWEITASGSNQSGPRHRASHTESDPYEAMLTGILARMASDLGITFDPKGLEEDSRRLDAGFPAAFSSYALEFTSGLKQYTVKTLVKRDILDLIFGLGPIQDLLEMDSVSEVMVVSRQQIFIEKFGVVEDSRRGFFSDEMLLAVIERIVSPLGRRIDRSSPLVDARLADGSRVNAVIPPLAVKGPCLTIRKFSKVPLEVDDLIRFGALSGQMKKFLNACVEIRKNIVVSGGTGTGKTTLLNCLSRFIPHKERIVTIEDTAELQLKQSHVVTLESRPANMEGKGAITIRDLVRNALRMRPDRVVVGECRGAEALDMLQAMNTGHDGSMTTAHANSPEDMILRLETMVLMGTDMPISAIREQIVSAVDIIVQLTRYSDGSRRVSQISEVVGIDETSGSVIVEDIFKYRPEPANGERAGRFQHTGYIPTFIQDLMEEGALTLDTFF